MPKDKLCKCGCGTPVGNLFVKGHYQRLLPQNVRSERASAAAKARTRLPEGLGVIDLYNHLFSLDPTTGKLTRRVYRAHNARAGDVVGTEDGKGYLHVSINRMFVRVHRIVFAMHYGLEPVAIDHVNRNKQDNRPENLRPATQSENAGNTWGFAHNTSGIKGVSRNTRSGMWHAQIKINGKQTYLGRYATKEQAQVAYNEAATKHFGEFARCSNG
jgi:hypothetical protein